MRARIRAKKVRKLLSDYENKYMRSLVDDEELLETQEVLKKLYCYREVVGWILGERGWLYTSFPKRLENHIWFVLLEAREVVEKMEINDKLERMCRAKLNEVYNEQKK